MLFGRRDHAAPARRTWWGRPASTQSFLTIMSVGALAAAVALVAGVRPLFESARARHDNAGEAQRLAGVRNTNGAAPRAGISVRVATADHGPQRVASADGPEALNAGERIRLSVQLGSHGFLFAMSIDDQGVVTPLYPESGSSLALPRVPRMQDLPDSLELTGKGRERLVVLLTDEELAPETVRAAAAAAFREAGGDLGKLPDLTLRGKGEQFHRTFLKP